MPLGIVLLAVAAVALVAGSALLGDGVSTVADARRLPAAPIRSATIGLAGALAATVVAAGQQKSSIGAGLPFGAAMFLLAAAFGAAALLGRRALEVREPITYAAPAAGIVLAALSVANTRAISRASGILLTIVFVPYLMWVLMEPGREAPQEPADPPGPDDEPMPPPHLPAGPVERPDAPWTVHETTTTPDAGRATKVEQRTPLGPAVVRALAGAVVVAGGGFALVAGTSRVAEHAKLAPGFAGAALAGAVAALPFALLVLFPRSRPADADPGGATLTAVTGLVTLVPGVAALVRPFELDGPAAISVLSVALLYALPATWMLLRGRGERVMGPLVLAAYAACLILAGSL
jgi:Ca2+/Na+ antiporter